jgi:hypothetical protein
MDSDAELTGLAAEILRDAVQVYNRSDIARWAAGHRGELGLGAVTGAFPAVTGGFAAVTSSSPAVTGSFPAITGAFRAVGSGQVPDAQVSLKKVFRLPRKLPAVRLPPSAELAALARSAPLMAVLEALARWLGRDGRLVTKEDELSDADAADAVQRLGIRPQYLPYLWDYALTSGWVELDDEPGSGRRRAVIGQTAWRWADGDNPGTLHVWAPIFAAVLASTLNVATASDPDASRKLEFQGQGVAMAIILFLARRAGLSRAEVGELVMSGAIGDWPSARTRRAWDSWVRGHGDPARWLVGELAGLRAVYMPETDEGAVELTPLALWALREQLRLDGIEIPLLPAVSQRMTAAGLVALADAVSDAEFEAEAASWMAARGPDRAARELLAFAAFSGPQPRITAVNLVRRIGIDAYQAWRDAMQRPELRGYARIALSMLAAGLPERTMPTVPNQAPDDLTWVATDLLALAYDDDGEPDPEQIAERFSEAIPQGEESWIFGLMSQSSHPDVAQALMVLGRYHPDRWVAKEARRAARAAAKNRTVARAGRVPARAAAR